MTSPIKNTVPVSYFFHAAGTAADEYKIFLVSYGFLIKYILYIFLNSLEK